ncbi:hypothetical protein ACFPER_14265 [Agromyces aurantiacus]|uniref:Uncharacterized protein n=1 Tax=Agromyces aurantiacus TaxID=165814 RepID=A0ABV9R9N4_9MICO|nr:hypothetical protein [Agromyces aurantiacus]MBM7505142.1 ABC-type enterochelin transport system permease subunit [Agromyces aurantiacus]
MTENTTPTTVRRRPLGLPIMALVGLALLAAPRVVLHDLGIVTEENPLTILLVVVPVAVWIAVAVAMRVPNPFLTLLVVGAMYGVILALGHQVMWAEAFEGAPPVVFGSELVPRFAAIVSSLFTGTIVGALAGLIAWGIRRGIDSAGRQPA